MEDKKHKREYRDCAEETKEKLRNNQSLHAPKSDLHKQHISQGLKNYWSTVEYKPTETTEDNLFEGEE